MNNPTILLVDNGSTRPDATLSLRRIAAGLGEATGEPVHPVSLQHAHKIDAAELDGIPADTLEPFLRARLERDERHFLVVPLFFGVSRALTSFIPSTVESLQETFGHFELVVADVLCPLPEGEPQLSTLLCDQVRNTAAAQGIDPSRVVLVDHGSPIPQVTAVRNWLARRMRGELGEAVVLKEAVMERREGPEYDFNGPLLADLLKEMATEAPDQPVIVAMLFLSPGRHAGAGGDVEQICREATGSVPGFQFHITPLVGEHSILIDILGNRVRAHLS